MRWIIASEQVVMCPRLKEKVATMMASTHQESSRKRRRGSELCAVSALTCAWCGLAVEDTNKASGLTGKTSDPVLFPHCTHALHAACLRAWGYSDSTTEQRQLLDRRRAPRYAKLVRGLALASYDYRFGGKCHGCAANVEAAADPQI